MIKKKACYSYFKKKKKDEVMNDTVTSTQVSLKLRFITLLNFASNSATVSREKKEKEIFVRFSNIRVESEYILFCVDDKINYAEN
jgi:hypothetical protein